MKTALHLIFFKTGLFEYGVIRKEIDPGSAFPALPHNRKKAVLQLHDRNPLLVPVFIYQPAVPDPYSQSGGQGIHYGRTHTVQAAACLIGRIVKFTAGMQSGEYKTFGAHAFFMHPYRNTSPVIIHRSRAVGFQRDLNSVAVTCQMLIHRIIHDFIYQMIQSLGRNTADVHTRSFPYRFQSLQYSYTGSVIITVVFSHVNLAFCRPAAL